MNFPKKELITILTWILVCISLGFTIPILFKFFQPVVIAGIVTLIVYPIVKFLENKLKIMKKFGVVIVSVLIIFLLALIGYFTFGFIYEEVINLIKDIPLLYKDFQKIFDDLVIYLKNLESTVPFIGEYIQTLEMFEFKLPDVRIILNSVTNITNSIFTYASGLPDLIINFIFICLFTVIFILNGSSIKSKISEILKLNDNENNEITPIIKKLKDILSGYVFAQLKLLMITFVIVFIGFNIINIPYIFLMSLLVAVLDMLPFFGTGTILGPYAVISFIYGDFRVGIGCIFIYLVTFVVRRAVEPKLVGDSVGVSSLFSIFCMFIGYRIMGVLGLIFGIPIGVIILYLYKLNFFKTFTNSVKTIFIYIKNIIFELK
jgi:sporulation integral membrane protein YtvI